MHGTNTSVQLKELRRCKYNAWGTKCTPMRHGDYLGI